MHEFAVSDRLVFQHAWLRIRKDNLGRHERLALLKKIRAAVGGQHRYWPLGETINKVNRIVEIKRDDDTTFLVLRELGLVVGHDMPPGGEACRG